MHQPGSVHLDHHCFRFLALRRFTHELWHLPGQHLELEQARLLTQRGQLERLRNCLTTTIHPAVASYQAASDFQLVASSPAIGSQVLRLLT